MDLAAYSSKARVLLLFSTSAAEYTRQRETLARAKDGMEDRDLVLLRVLDDAGGDASPEEAADLRDRFAVERGGFAVVLIGKDGTEKFRSREPVEAEEIFERIDTMPMRRREMREPEMRERGTGEPRKE